MYSIGIAATLLGICVKKLPRWDKSKKIVCFRILLYLYKFSSFVIKDRKSNIEIISK
jgi:hypothetical protein